MAQFLVWFNMIGFTLVFASAGLVWLEYAKHRDHWLRDFLVFQASHGFWLLFSTYIFFEVVFLTEPIPWIESAFAYVRLVASAGSAIFGFLFYLRMIGIQDGKTLGIATTSFTGLIALLVAGGMALQSAVLLGASNVLFNVTLTAASLLATRALLHKPAGRRRMMLPFTVFTSVAFPVLVLGNVWFGFFDPDFNYLEVNVLAGGMLLFLWSVLVGAIFLRRIGRTGARDSIVPETLARDFGITNREAEIIRELARGATSKEIGDTLFISQRTVETHIYNIYRKCNAGNRVEFLALLRRYSD